MAVNQTKIPALVEFTLSWGRQIRNKINEHKNMSDGKKGYGKKTKQGQELLFFEG